ncbi:(2Fe-2S)-binding protein [Kitasatospora atroaurantiaca]|uniref:FhuF-like iron-sulfur protein n=2 Tax=Kitasatospora atroaurantiaca TaxID=285545 RepID=A0A561EYC5_9ACTN|nr:FhuF-like iron-sulfur protein [Kitasatospora atroaurantiaca]
MLQMTAVPPHAADRLAETYRQLAGIGGGLRVDLMTSGQPFPKREDGWVRASALAGGVDALIAAEAARIEAEHGCAPRMHVAASRLLHHYLWSACLLLSGPWYLTGQVPRLRPEDLAIEVSTGDLAVRPGVAEPGGERELREAVAGYVEPALDAFQPYVKRGPRALWGMVTDDLVSGIWYLGRMLDEEERAAEVAAAVLPGDTPPFLGAADFRRLPGTDGRTHLTRTRLGCCLYYAIRPADTCLTCPRTGDAERVRRLEA